MFNKSNYSCDEALNDLEHFFKKHIVNANELKYFMDHLAECRCAGRIGFRFIHQELMVYRKACSDYFLFDDEDQEMIENLFHFWG